MDEREEHDPVEDEQPVPDDKPSVVAEGLKASGRGLVRAGAWLGRKAVDAYKTVDPDVPRHLLQLPLLSYSLFLKRQVQPEPAEDDGHPPLIFVHGMAGNRGSFQLMAWYFHLVGRKRSYRVGFEAGQDLSQQAQALADFVAEVLTVNQAESVDLVAHSMGGLVCRLAMGDARLAGKVTILLTMGTPHKGTYPARYANTENTRALRPDSDFIRMLNERGMPPGVKLVCLWSDNDLFVLPPRSAILDGALAIDATPATHYGYLLDPKAFKLVRQGLAKLSSP